MKDGYAVTPHSNEWYDRLATLQDGYFYPWQSRLGSGNGEQAYLELVDDHLTPATDVLEVACGHGEHALSIASKCRSISAYDRVRPYVDLAERNRLARAITNVTFVCHDSSAAANGGGVVLPGDDNSYDLLISRRGPFHWIEVAVRVARSGAVLLMLCPDGTNVLNSQIAWRHLIPEPFQLPPSEPPELPVWENIRRRLNSAGIEMESCWVFDVPEWFDQPLELYKCLSFWWGPDEVPIWEKVRPAFEEIFRDHAGPSGLAIPHSRTLWKAVIP